MKDVGQMCSRHGLRRRRRLWVASALAVGVTITLDLPASDGETSSVAEAAIGFAATPLSADEEALPALRELVGRFNPAMALPDADGPWPVDVAYAWSAGADLRARTVTPGGRNLRDSVAFASARMANTSWGDLPSEDLQGNRIEYWIDVPGDDLPAPNGRSAWRERWRAIAGDDPARSAFPPTQYAHPFWLDRERGLLAIQYWFFFPFNEWINHHEGDWEHVEVILRGTAPLDGVSAAGRFLPVGYLFFFHGWRYRPEQVLRVSGAQDGTPEAGASGDHVVVFTGGRGQFLWWGGSQSGGSYPLPALYAAAGCGFGPFRPADDTRHPARFLPAAAFRVVLLPEPARLDAVARPELSWLRLPFFAGAARARTNPPLTDAFGGGSPSLQPGRRREWGGAARHPLWSGKPLLDQAADQVLPSAWRLITPNAQGSQPTFR